MATVEQDRWIERLRADDHVRDKAIGELREILLRGVKAAFRSHSGGKISAEDVVQDTLIKILESLGSFQGRSKFTTWAMTIAVRTAIGQMRRQRFKDVSMSDLLDNNMLFEPMSALGENGQVNSEKISILKMLRKFIDENLTEKQRGAMHSLLNGIPVEVYAEKTGSNRNAVYKLVHDARVKLRRSFEEVGYTAEDIDSVFV